MTFILKSGEKINIHGNSSARDVYRIIVEDKDPYVFIGEESFILSSEIAAVFNR